MNKVTFQYLFILRIIAPTDKWMLKKLWNHYKPEKNTIMKINFIYILMFIFLTSFGEESNRQVYLQDLQNKMSKIEKEFNLPEYPRNVDTMKVIMAESFPLLFGAKFNASQLRGLYALHHMKPVFRYIKMEYGVPEAVTAAMFIIETRWGQSYMFKKHNNLGGIKAHNWDGRTFKAFDDCGEDKCKFRSYYTLNHGVKDWAKVLTRERYTSLLHNPATASPEAWLEAYAEGGYWTDPNGLAIRKSLLKTYKLANFNNN